MPKKNPHADAFFEGLCRDYYEKVLKYLYFSLRDESAARDCTQDVFLTALQKSSLLEQHPNPGGFLFQTAKNLARKHRREGFRRLLKEAPLEEDHNHSPDPAAGIEDTLDKAIDEGDYIESVLDHLPPDKRQLYSLYYVSRRPMSEIAALLGVEEATLRMRYVRLRREIRTIAARVAEEYFIS